MPKRRIFISHSSKGEAGLALLTATAAALDARGYELRFDRKNLVPGDDWYGQVSEYMFECEGAVLLWDRNAASSPYVRHEASVLSHRWRTEERNFKLFVALIDDAPVDRRLKRTDLSDGELRASRIAEAHIWSAPEEVRGNAEALAAALTAAAVETLGAGEYRTTRRDWLIEGLSEKLEENLSPEALRAAIDEIDQEDLDQVVAKLPLPHLFRAASSWMAACAASDIGPVRQLVEAFEPNLRGGHDKIIRFLRAADAEWLSDGRASCPIGSAVMKSGTGAAAAVNGARTPVYTLESLARRALKGERIRIVPCHQKALDEEEVASEICAKLSVDLDVDRDEATINAALMNERTLCLLAKGYPGSSADHHLIKDLRNRFPQIVFVAWPAERALERRVLDPSVAAAAAAGGPADGIVPIAPEIDLVRETQRFVAWRGLQSILDGQ